MAKFRTDINLTHQFNTTTSTSWIPNGLSEGSTGIVELDADTDFDHIDAIYFEATLLSTLVGSIPENGDTVQARLYSKTDSEAVTNSEVSLAGDTTGVVTRIRSSDIKSYFSGAGATEIFYQYKTTHASYQCTVSACRLIIIQNGAVTKTAIYHMIGTDQTITFSGLSEITQRRRTHINENNYDGSIAYEWHTTTHSSGGATTTSELYNATDSASISTINETNSSPTFNKNTGLSMTTNKEYTTRVRRYTTGTGYIRSAYLVMKLTNGATPLTHLVAPIQVFSGRFVGTSPSYSTNNNKVCGWDVADYDNCTHTESWETSMLCSNPGFVGIAYCSILETATINAGSENSTNSTSYIRQNNGYTDNTGSNIDVDAKGKAFGRAIPLPGYDIVGGRIVVVITNMTEPSGGATPLRMLMGIGQ